MTQTNLSTRMLKEENLMKAIIQTKPGPPEVLQLREVEKPVPGDNEILVRVHASTVTQGDVMLRKLHPLMYLPMRLFGIKRKKTPGHEFAGRIEAVGKDVTLFRVGEQVLGTTTGLRAGANAEYVCVPEQRDSGVLAVKPPNVPYEDAATLLVGGLTALDILQKGNIQSGQEVLIYGASGSVGTFAVQLARHFGAKVTAVCSTGNIEMVKSLGAEEIIDYTKERFTKGSQKYDLVFDAVGKTSAADCKPILKEKGIFLTVQSTTHETAENLALLVELSAAGKIKSVIDQRYPLAEIAEAHRYVEAGHKRGNVVITTAE